MGVSPLGELELPEEEGGSEGWRGFAPAMMSSNCSDDSVSNSINASAIVCSLSTLSSNSLLAWA